MASSPWTVAAELCAAEVTGQRRAYDVPVPNESVEFDQAPVPGFSLARPRSMGTAFRRATRVAPARYRSSLGT
jgi:hypothetical protein